MLPQYEIKVNLNKNAQGDFPAKKKKKESCNDVLCITDKNEGIIYHMSAL